MLGGGRSSERPFLNIEASPAAPGLAFSKEHADKYGGTRESESVSGAQRTHAPEMLGVMMVLD